MNPKTPELLGRVLKLAEQVLDRPSGDPRRQDAVEKLFGEVHDATSWGTDEKAGRLINQWTVLLVQMMRKIEALGPMGDADELVRAATMGSVLLGFVQRDCLAALEIKARGGRADVGGRR
jgi:hypothetical protein